MQIPGVFLVWRAYYQKLQIFQVLIILSKLRNGEIDFTVKNLNGEIEYYQVSWSIANTQTEEREYAPLENVNDNYPKFLLTTDSFPQGKSGIIHRNVFDWLLEKYS